MIYLFFPGVKVTLISLCNIKKTMFCNIVDAFSYSGRNGGCIAGITFSLEDIKQMFFFPYIYLKKYIHRFEKNMYVFP